MVCRALIELSLAPSTNSVQEGTKGSVLVLCYCLGEETEIVRGSKIFFEVYKKEQSETLALVCLRQREMRSFQKGLTSNLRLKGATPRSGTIITSPS